MQNSGTSEIKRGPLERLVWCDTETTGLDPMMDQLLEVGFLITDLEFVELDRMKVIIQPGDMAVIQEDQVIPFVWDMHTKSGLWSDIKNGAGYRLHEAIPMVEAFLDKHEVCTEDPICGSSVQFDRSWLGRWMPTAMGKFSYRNIDVSTLKELMLRLSPDIYVEMPDDAKVMNRKTHRVIEDIEDTISELRFYRNEFLYVPGDFR